MRGASDERGVSACVRLRQYPLAVPNTPMPTSPPPSATPTISVPGGAGLERLKRAEWVLADGLGGFAMGTASGIPTRRYHGLLVASLTPPVQREVMLHSLVERLTLAPGTPHERVFELGAFEFAGGTQSPRGWELLERFECGTSCRWIYRCGDVRVTKTLRLVRGGSASVIEYAISPTSEVVVLEVRPLVAMRDAHELMSASTGEPFSVERDGRKVRVKRRGRVLELTGDPGFFDPTPQWWYRFQYAIESSRGLDDVEDLWSPGVLAMQARPSGAELKFTITAAVVEPLSKLVEPRRAGGWAAESEAQQRVRLDAMAVEVLKQVRPATSDAERKLIARLVSASDAFVVKRGTGAGGATPGVTIIAGYPWFSDWGRDSMISMRGLLLATRRFEEARSLLETFASHMRGGMVPNLFDDQTGEAWYNTVDASLWFLHAATEYLLLTGDRAGFDGKIKSACLAIIDAYRGGTEFKIGMDPADGLIAAGDETTQLTWMDAKRDGVVFTPRHGKCVEINALWYHGLMRVARAIEPGDAKRAKELRELAARVGESFRKVFWNASAGCCHDLLMPESGAGKKSTTIPTAGTKAAAPESVGRGPVLSAVWRAETKIRPNQLFAVSLEFSPLTEAQRESVLGVVRTHLLTPLGLRTLSPGDPGYRPRFRGRMMERDAAYHNGTVWPWLIGSYVEASLRVANFSADSRERARRELSALLAQLDDGDALGQLYEVFDAEETPGDPRQPGGCMAQAWSVAETLRAMLMVHG